MSVYNGSNTGISTSPNASVALSYCQTNMAIGDFNGDGYADFACGTNVYYGTGTGVSSTPSSPFIAPSDGTSAFGNRMMF